MASQMIIAVVVLFCIYQAGSQTTNRPGHLKPFGTGKTTVVDRMFGFPSVDIFFRDYVKRSKPLHMQGSIGQSFAVRQWTDEYFLSVDVPNSLKVNVETTKKEDRKQNVILMHFHEFVRTYNHTEQYMVQTVPEFLR